MFDELFPEARANSLGQQIQRPAPPPPEPGIWTGFGSALADSLPYAGQTTGSAWAAILEAYGQAVAYRDAPTVAMLHGEAPPDLNTLKRDTIGQIGNSEIARGFRERAKDFAPRPEEVGIAGQIVHSLAGGLAKMTAYSGAGPVGPLLFGGDVGINRAQELTDKGVDPGTAAAAGTVSAVAGAAMMKIPPALGATRTQSAAIGAVVAPALTVAEIGSIQALLLGADYAKIAAQYQPFDPLNLTIAALSGGLFGAAFHGVGRPPGAPKLTPDEHAAALTMHEVRTREADALTRPGDVAAANAAHEAQTLVRQQIDSGELISLAPLIDAELPRLNEVRQSLMSRVVDKARGISEEIVAAADRVVGFVQRSVDNPRDNSSVETLSTISEAKRQLILQRTGIDVGQAREELRADIVRHAQKEHAELTPDDWRLLPWLMQNFDEVRLLKPQGNDKGPRLAFAARDPMTGLAYVAEALAGRKKGERLSVVTFFKDHPNTVDNWLETNGAAGTAEGGRPREPMPPDGSPIPTSSTLADIQSLAREGRTVTPEHARAIEIAARNPDAIVRMEDGSEVRMADVINHAEAVEAQAKTESAAFDAAVTCALRFPPS